ncbi:hypothetical protein [Pseudoalteromonas sp. H105]|uniref:hypothetical protein n=1 Tax=Pseudoalteromonas sp. H105 TaxID=1348393 RepID=UPI000732169B|nr:hypothetical protein [Pseudoalteromonas sp. H105]KTF18411.1 hypothetical protein ATS75_03105 [Pseudoalteromonas sp. H105]
MIKKIIPLCVFSVLVGCGGSSDDTASTDAISLPQTSSQVSFYIAPWQSPAGTLKITNEQTAQVRTLAVDDVNSLTIDLTSLEFHKVEFISDSVSLPCPSFDGCGRTLRDNPNDENGNRRIDYQEVMDIPLDYAAKFFAAPGSNNVYLSPVSALSSAENLDVTLASLSATPFYHLTHSQLNDNLEAEMLTNALTFGVILQKAREIESQLNTQTTIVSTEVDFKSGIESYAPFAQQYLAENLLNVQGNQLIQSVAGEIKQRIFSLSKQDKIMASELPVPTLDSRQLLDDVRNALAVIRLQEQKYSDELTQKLTQAEALLDTDSQQTVLTFTNVIFDVLSNFSPASNTNAGTYKIGNLDVIYAESPYRWQISGMYDDHQVQIDMNVPKWQISSVLGNQINGEISAKINRGITELTVDVSELILDFDGTDDPFDLTQEEVTGIANITTMIKLEKEGSEIEGTLTANIDRFVSPFEELLTVISGFDFDGVISSDIQTTGIAIQAIEKTPFINEDSANISFSLMLDMPLNGAPGFKLAYVGDMSNLDVLNNANIFITLDRQPLDIAIRQVGENTNAVIKGQHGRWIDIKQKGRNFSGGLYFGDTQIADVTAVRGVPGILFSDGTFESLF